MSRVVTMENKERVRKMHRRTRVLSREDKEKIIILYSHGSTQTELARMFGVSQPRISKLIKEIVAFEIENYGDLDE